MTTKFKIVLINNNITGTSEKSVNDLIKEIDKAFIHCSKKKGLWLLKSSKGIQLVDLSKMELVEMWEE